LTHLTEKEGLKLARARGNKWDPSFPGRGPEWALDSPDREGGVEAGQGPGHEVGKVRDQFLLQVLAEGVQCIEDSGQAHRILQKKTNKSHLSKGTSAKTKINNES
jgi:hypothetical protein